MASLHRGELMLFNNPLKKIHNKQFVIDYSDNQSINYILSLKD